jgi:hypothetical protein
MTWTVGAPAYLTGRWSLVGKTLGMAMYISWFSGSNTLSGSASPNLIIRIPGGFQGQTNQYLLVPYQFGTAGPPNLAGLYATPSGFDIHIRKADNSNFALTDIPGMIFTLFFEVL